MKAQLFQQLCSRLDDKLNQKAVTEVHGRLDYISRFSDQFNNEDKENGIPKPAIAIKISATYKTEGQGTQRADVLVTIYLAYHNSGDFRFGDPRQKEALNAYCYLEEIHKALHGWLGLNRIADDEDQNYDIMITDNVMYQTTLLDKSANKRAGHKEFLLSGTVQHDPDLGT